MKTKSLFLGIMLFVCSVFSMNAQTLLISEDFSSPAWAAEVLRLNPSYVKPNNSSFFGVQSALPYTVNSHDYLLNGAIISCDGKTAGNLTNTCASFATTGIVHNDIANVALGFRLRSGATQPVLSTYIEFPEIASAGAITVHVRNGSTSATTTTLTLQKYVSGAWTDLKAFSLAKGSSYQSASIDEIKTFNIFSKDPVKLRLVGGLTFIMIFRVDIEVYNKNNLQTSITNANTLKNANTDNIGSSLGSYTQVSYDALSSAITTATTLYNLATAKSLDVDNGIVTLNNAISAFQASINKSDLQTGITNATLLKDANSGNIGTAVGQYPQAGYDAFVAAITAATTVYDNATAISAQVITGLATLNAAMFTFKASGTPVTVSGETLVSGLTLTAASNISVINCGLLTIDGTIAINNLVVEGGGKVTVNEEASLTVNDFILKSDPTNGTATFVDNLAANGLTVTGTSSIQQYLKGGRNWYVSSPLTAAKSGVVTTNASNKLWSYDEANVVWNPITDTNTTLNQMTGYVAKPAADGGITFTGGTPNTGDLAPITLYRTENENASRGFNLVGNPYPSYVNWESATKTNLRNTIWFRSRNADDTGYIFDTYGATAGEGTNLNGTAVTADIPPMQAFWVRVEPGQTTGTLAFSNSMRSHETGTNRMKVQNNSRASQKVLRLQVSNEVSKDEAIVLFNPNASDEYDAYDSPKMTNNNVDIPEIFTAAGNEQLVINGLKSLNGDKEIALGFSTGAMNTFAIKATEIRNFDSGSKIILKDNLLKTEQDITDGTPYTFSSDVDNTTNRFSLLFKAPSVTTAVDNNSTDKLTMYAYRVANNQIRINCSGSFANEGTITVCNSIGQKLVSTQTTGKSTLVSGSFNSGIYFVTVMTEGTKITRRLIIN